MTITNRRKTLSAVLRCWSGLLFLLPLTVATSAAAADERIPAFPGAEGFGRYAKGGRGGQVLFVTTLKDYDPAREPAVPGSLRAACLAKGPRTVIFHVSGTIHLKSYLHITEPYLTLAGQTAPGDGICLTRHGTSVVDTHDVIIRHLRFRPGDAVARELARTGNKDGWQSDSLNVVRSQHVIIDHCSASWSTDEVLSVSHTPLDNVTVQWCFITEALNKSFHHKGEHGYGGLDARAANARITRCYNLYAHNTTRAPRVGSVHDENLERVEKEFGIEDSGLLYDFRNNVIYNWLSRAGYTAAYCDRIRMNYIGNALVAGPDTRKPIAFDSAKRAQIYLKDNLMNGKDLGWAIIRGRYRKSEDPFPAAPVTTVSAEAAYERVLQEAGATMPRRDAVDTRMFRDVRRKMGRIIDSQRDVGGYGRYREERRPVDYDTDHDGVPDVWEKAHGFDPTKKDASGDRNGNGYTNLEEFLNGTNPKN